MCDFHFRYIGHFLLFPCREIDEKVLNIQDPFGEVNRLLALI